TAAGAGRAEAARGRRGGREGRAAAPRRFPRGAIFRGRGRARPRPVAPSLMEPARRLRRAHVVTYYFPPAGGPAVPRVLTTVKYLRGYGYEPTVLTVADGAYPQRDPTLAADVPEGVVVHRTRSFDPFGLYARLTGKPKAEAVPVGSIGGGSRAERLARWG